MTDLYGIDVSYHNGHIDWLKVKHTVDFAIIRAGYGKNNIDKEAENNVWGCIENGIPFGLYWFSYALNTDMVKEEADYLCDFADRTKPTFPLCFDWEYDSDNFATKSGVVMTNDKREQFARIFLNRVEERGYYAMLYSNVDYINNKGFADLLSRYDLWLAHWGVSKPSVPCGIWQSTEKGKVNGIKGNVDVNHSYKDYTKYCKTGVSTPVTDKNNDNAVKKIDAIIKELTELKGMI